MSAKLLSFKKICRAYGVRLLFKNDVWLQEQLVRLWKHHHLVEAAEGLSYEEMPALWYVRGTSLPSLAVPFDVAVASKYMDVTDLTKRHLPGVFEVFSSGSSHEPGTQFNRNNLDLSQFSQCR